MRHVRDRTLVNVSFCWQHFKGGDGVGRRGGQEHAEWLEEAVCLYLALGYPHVVVGSTGFPGILDVENAEGNCERDVAWRILHRGVQVIGSHGNPGHQVGAALCIRAGLEAAGKWGFDYLLHTAEDVCPRRGAIERMLAALEAGADYAGEPWGFPDDSGVQVQRNAQFFACRTQALVGPWDACAVTGHGCIEMYLADLLRGRPEFELRGAYRTCHDRDLWHQWLREEGY